MAPVNNIPSVNKEKKVSEMELNIAQIKERTDKMKK
jgi:hypothetical protein